MSLEYRCLGSSELDSRKLSQIRKIYLASFPPSEREPFSALAADIRRGRASVWAALGDGGVQGFGITLALPIQGTAYLAYLAVDPTRRGMGVGGRLFRTILEMSAAPGEGPALVWEVERPEPDATPEDPKRRRIAFYQRHGGMLLEKVRDFRMPDLAPRKHKREPGTVPAMLMWAPGAERAALTRAETLALVAAVYRVGYGRDLTNPLVRYVLSTVADGPVSR
jgi:ribosomal protein S18 acetylase RimI-like enzyme